MRGKIAVPRLEASASFRIEGLQELDKALSQLEPRLRNKHMTRALRAGAKIIQKDMKARAPVDTGNLKRWIRVGARLTPRQKRNSRREIQGAAKFIYAGAVRGESRDDGAFYAHFVEFGTATQPPQPFGRPAVDSNRLSVLNKIKQVLATGLKQTAREVR